MNEKIEAVSIAASNKSMIAGAATGIVGWLSQINWIGVAGTLIALMGLLASIYFQIRRDHRETREHEARMKKYEAENGQC